jgi:uncharacterized protein (TIRG00374 family)
MAAAAIDPADRASALGSLSPRKLALLVGASALLVVGAVVIAPAVAGLPDVWQRIAHGDMWWLGFAVVLEALSFVGHIILFRAVSLDGGGRIGMRASTEITLAGHMATRLFAAGGAGGIALTAWAMRKAGMDRRDVAARMTTFLVLLYVVYMAAMIFGGLGLYLGIIPGGGSFAITVVPAIFALILFALFLAMTLLSGDTERRLAHWAAGSGRFARIIAKAVTIPASAASGVRMALRLARDRELGLLGAVAWWGFDLATLWACFHAYGYDPPPVSVIVMAYFVGMLGNTLPLPGGIGGVDGGMIGAFVAFHYGFNEASLAVITYRAFAFWLPTVPGAIAYFQLRRTVAGWRAESRASETAAKAAPAQA